MKRAALAERERILSAEQERRRREQQDMVIIERQEEARVAERRHSIPMHR